MRIDETRLVAYAARLPAAEDGPAIDPAAHPPGKPLETVAAYTLCLDAVNFGSGWWPTVRKRPGCSGYQTMAGALADRFRAHGPWEAAQLARIETAEIAAVLGQDPEHELMALYAGSLRDLGTHVRDDAGGAFAQIVGDAGGSAVALATRLAGWDCFADASRYDELEVPFYKRAQLACADLHRAGVARFSDLRRLTAFADNLVPHVLALDGVLVLASRLQARIDAGELLVHGSPEEVELRACAVHAVELLAAASPQRPAPAPATIDAILWNRGAARRYKARPRPRSRNTAY